MEKGKGKNYVFSGGEWDLISFGVCASAGYNIWSGGGGSMGVGKEVVERGW